MKKIILILLATLILFGCSTPKEESQVEEVVDTTTTVEIEKPFVEVETLEELNNIMGFDFIVPDKIDVGVASRFSAYEKIGLSEAEWLDGEETFAFARKILTSNLEEDVDSITGLYETFDEIKDVDGYKISFIDGIAYVSEWTDGDFSLAFVMLNGASEEIILEVSKTIK